MTVDLGTLDAPPVKRMSVRFNPEVGLGQIINALIMASGIAYAIVTYANRVDTTQRDLTSLHQEMVTRFDTVSEQFRGVRLDIANLPDVRAELVQLGRRMDQADNRMGAQSNRLEQIQQMTIQNRADMDNIIRGRARP
jgi:hypothetical protein